MKKIAIQGKIKDKDRLQVLCPICGRQTEAALFETKTSLCIYSIPVKKIHNRFVAVCTNCKRTFEVEPEE